MPAVVFSSSVFGIDAILVEVEVDISRGLPAFTTVGLPEVAVRESRVRVKSALKNSGYRFPGNRITVNLAPADMKKEGTGFDLPIALGILAASGVIPKKGLEGRIIQGELSLDGRIKRVKGVLPMAMTAKQSGLAAVMVPKENENEAAVVKGIDVYGVETLSQAVEFLLGKIRIEPAVARKADCRQNDTEGDFAEVAGQERAKRALEIAAAGGHNILMIGPPGSGKTMLARRLSSILPKMTFEEAVETTKIYSVAGRMKPGCSLITARPFRAPHHTISDAGLIGGGNLPMPGETSLAHNGILFMDELPEFKKHVLEALRQPIEDEQVTIARAAGTVTYPSRFMLVAAMNPCPCGFMGDEKKECTCSTGQIERYRSKISGPLLDRIDIHINVPPVPYEELRDLPAGEPSADIRARVEAARRIQEKRFKRNAIYCNAGMKNRHIKAWCSIDTAGSDLLKKAVERFGLSARAYTRILKISRTIADLEGSSGILFHHLAEALQYRSQEKGALAIYY